MKRHEADEATGMINVARKTKPTLRERAYAMALTYDPDLKSVPRKGHIFLVRAWLAEAYESGYRAAQRDARKKGKASVTR